MILSMTGFGKSKVDLIHKKISVEVKTLNSKNIDLNIKVPPIYKDKENEIRAILSENIIRGKVDFFINISSDVEKKSKNYFINKDLLNKYISELKEINSELDFKEYLKIAIKMPEIIVSDEEEVDDDQWLKIERGILLAIQDLNKFRKDEGNKLLCELDKNINFIISMLDEIVPFEQTRIQKIRNNILTNLRKINVEFDENRMEQELLYYIEKLDINEEKIRLKAHLEYFLEELHNDNISSGKKLNFISQEIGREINTLGNKSNHLEIQKIVVSMKENLEKIKEQVMNIL